MFCDEPIKRVYVGERIWSKPVAGANAYFDHFCELAYHVTEGYRLVLETEHWAITLDHDGVKKDPKELLYTRKEEWLHGIDQDPDDELLEPEDEPYEDFKTTLFVGQRLKDVLRDNDIFLAQFDDFTLKIIPYALGTMGSLPEKKDDWSYCRTCGCQWLLKRRCDCGGEGEILVDFVWDYVVRCKRCGRSTYADMQVRSAIESWNRGEVPCVLDDITVE